jgi:hypothetical protein
MIFAPWWRGSRTATKYKNAYQCYHRLDITVDWILPSTGYCHRLDITVDWIKTGSAYFSFHSCLLNPHVSPTKFSFYSEADT